MAFERARTARSVRATAAAVALLLATSARAQAVMDLPNGCPACRLTWTPMVTLQDVWDDGGLTGAYEGASRFATGEWAVIDARASTVYRFDRSGRFIGPLARKGGGPGEMQAPVATIRIRGDSTMFLDRGNARYSIYDPDGERVREGRWLGSAPGRALVRPNGRFVTAERIGTRGSLGLPLHEWSPDAELLHSFGSKTDAAVRTPGEVPLVRVPTAELPDGSFWTIDANAPRMRHWNRDGELMEEWLIPLKGGVVWHNLADVRTPTFEFYGVEHHAGDVVLVVMAYHDKRAIEAFGAERYVDGATSRTIEDWGRFLDTRVYALDVRRRTVLATLDLDELLFQPVGQRVFFAIAPGRDNGILRFGRLEFTRP